MNRIPRAVGVLLVLVLLATACGDDDTGASSDGTPTVVVTTNILGDVVTNITGGAVDVITIMPVGADPHDFQASAREADTIRSADALVVNGGGFEEGLVDVIESAASDGVVIFAALDAVSTIEFGADDHDDHDDHDQDAHGHGGPDPHFFTDPARMAVAATAISEFLIATVDGLDVTAVRNATADYVAELERLDAEVESLITGIPEENRILVTNHEVFGYFADRYGFEVVGAVIPSGTTTDSASAGQLAELAELIEQEGVPAIFADVSSSDRLVQTLAGEVGDVIVESLYSESLGAADSDGATYVAMVRSNAERIAGALGG